MPPRAKRAAKQALIEPDSEDEDYAYHAPKGGDVEDEDDFAPPAAKKVKAPSGQAKGKKGKVAAAPRGAKLALFVQMPLDVLSDVRLPFLPIASIYGTRADHVARGCSYSSRHGKHAHQHAS